MFKKKPTSLKFAGTLGDKYKGPGVALAACVNDEVVDLVYLIDIFPDFDGTVNSQKSVSLLANLMEDARAKPSIKQLEAKGRVLTGTCGDKDFMIMRLGWYI